MKAVELTSMLVDKHLISRRGLLRRVGVTAALGLLDSTLSAATSDSVGPARLDYVCPMDANVRSDKPGFCSKCGMRLRLGIPDLKEYQLDVSTTPSVIHPNEKVRFLFTFRDPDTGTAVRDYEVVHQKLFHLFFVSSDLKYFMHEHPVIRDDGSFVFEHLFPKAGMYRMLADVFPSAGSPQLIPKTIFVSPRSGDSTLPDEASLAPDLGVQHGANTDVQVSTIPEKPMAGTKTILFFKFNKADGMEKYLDAWAHMLVASDDTIDLMHEHPSIADGGAEMQFTLILPRERTYRVWLQFQRSGVLNTVAVNIPVVTLAEGEGIQSR